MKIFADKMIASVLAGLLTGLEGEDVSIVQLEQAGEAQHLQDSIGFTQAIEEAKAGRPVLMLGWMPKRMYIANKSKEWFAAMGFPHVMLCTLPLGREDFVKAIELVKADKRQPDPLALALLNIDQKSTAVSVLHHDLYHAEKDAARMVRWIEKAQKVFGDKSRDELVKLVKSAKEISASEGEFAGQTFADVCIDVEGTLLVDGQIRTEVLALAQEKANGGPITVWTGGEIYSLTAQLRKAGIIHKIVSKHAMKGATVRVVIDDLTEEAFKSEYGVGYEEYVQV